MRRKDREVTDPGRIVAMMENCQVLHLAIQDEPAPYLLPVNFGMEPDGMTLYIHGALQGKKYEEQYEKVSRYVLEHKDEKILFLELGVGRLTPMFIQEPFWNLTLSFPKARYIAVNNQYDFLPKDIEKKGMVIKGDIAKVLKDAAERVCKK